MAIVVVAVAIEHLLDIMLVVVLLMIDTVLVENDHNWVLRKGTGLRKAATLESTKTGIVMEVLTEEPAIQFYSGNFLTDQMNYGKGGATYGYRSALCLETQHFPDSPNQPAFPNTILRPGQEYATVSTYRFSVEK